MVKSVVNPNSSKKDKFDKNDKTMGIIYIIMAAFFFACMSFFVRISGDVPTMQKSFFRNAVAMVVSFVMLLKSKEGLVIKKGSVPSLLLRSIFGTLGMVMNFYALDRMNISDANMLNKLAPFFAIIMSIFILKEKANKIEWLAVFVAFSGALLVVKPSFSLACIPSVAAALGGFGAGVAYTFVRKLGIAGERGPVIVMFFSVFSTVLSLPFLIFDYHPMESKQLIALLLAGLFATGGQLCVTKAYTKAPAKEISVYDYAQVIFAAILGMIFLNQVPDYLSILGYIIIIGAAVSKYLYTTRNPN